MVLTKSLLVTVLASGVFALIGWACLRFGALQFRGHPLRGKFLAWGGLAVVGAVVLALSDNLAVVLAAWLLGGMAAGALLRLHGDREGAGLAAREKFMASRIGDLPLLAALGLSWHAYGTWSISQLVERMAADPSWVSRALPILLVMGAVAKSAQVPFHSWLPRTIEAPTAVSALLHAGIVNAGTVLLLKFSDAVVREPVSVAILLVSGTLSVVAGLSASGMRPDAKGALAWSTVGQTGFVLIEIASGAVGAAILHLAGHALYKSWAFLNASALPNQAPSGEQARSIPEVVARFALVLGLVAAWVWWTGRLPGWGHLGLWTFAGLALAAWAPRGVRGSLALGGLLGLWGIVHAWIGRIDVPMPSLGEWVFLAPLHFLPVAGLAFVLAVRRISRTPGSRGRSLAVSLASGWSLAVPLARRRDLRRLR